MRSELPTTSSQEVNLLNSSIEPVKYKVSTYRWVVISSYAFIVFWISAAYGFTAPIAVTLQHVYDKSLLTVTMMPIAFSIVYVPATMMALPIISKFGPRISIAVGCFFVLICLALRLFINLSFWYMFASCIIAGIGQPFIQNTCTTFSNNWFPIQHRALATAIGAVAGTMGTGVGYVWPVLFITEKEAKANKEKGKEQVLNAIIFESCVITCCMIIGLIFLRNNPKFPPSKSACKTDKREPFLKGLKTLSKDYNMWALFFSSSIAISFLLCLAAQSNALLEPFGLGSNVTLGIGLTYTITGIIGATLYSLYLGQSRAFKKCLLLIIGVPIILFNGLIVSGFAHTPALSIFVSGLLGFAIVPIIAIGQEFGCEIGFPVAESTISGIILAGGQSFTVLSLFVSGIVLDNASELDVVYFGIGWTGILFAILLLASTIKENLKRTNHENEPVTNL